MYAIAFTADVDPDDFRRAFPTKLDLIYTLAVDRTHRLVEGGRAAADPASSPREQMRGLVRHHIGFSWRHRTELELRRRLMPTLRAIYPERHRELSALLRAYRDRVHALIERGRAAGQFADSPDPAAVTAMAVLRALESILYWYDSDSELSLDQLSDVYVDLVIHHLLGAARD